MSLEFPYESAETEVESESILADIDAIVADADHKVQTMESRELHVSQLLKDIEPQTPEDERTLADLNERLAQLPESREDLSNVRHAAALDVLVKALATPAEADDGMRDEMLARVLADNPDMLKALLSRLSAVTQMTVPSGEAHIADHASHQKFAEDTKALLAELDATDKKLFKGVALRTLERVVRAALSAGTLGIGGLVYDSAKDALVNMQKRKEIRSRRQKLLDSASVRAFA
jgi:hypothetical protein